MAKKRGWAQTRETRTDGPGQVKDVTPVAGTYGGTRCRAKWVDHGLPELVRVAGGGHYLETREESHGRKMIGTINSTDFVETGNENREGWELSSGEKKDQLPVCG